jgi:L-iditol 2-dehydrogenase
MKDTMRAVIYYGVEDIRVEDIAIPSCADDEIRLKVDACAVCGTDMKSYYSGNPRIKAPIVMGHEFTGLVETVGKNVKNFEMGDRVVMATSVSCGECFYCKKGHNNLCSDLKPMGFHFPGGMAEYVVIPALALKNGHAVKVPAGVKAEHAALVEPLSCAVNSNVNSGTLPGDTVVVSGAGPLGIMNLCVARALGAGKLILAEISGPRLKQAEVFGFDALVNPLETDLKDFVLKETDGIGADRVIVAAPAAQPQEAALDFVRKQGTVCLFASLPSGKSMLNVDSRTIHYGEIHLVGTSDSTPKQVQKAVELLTQPDFPSDKIASHILDLAEVKKSFELMKSGEALRVVLKP